MNGRIKILTAMVFLLGLCIIGRLFELQVLGRNFLGNEVYQRKITEQLIPANRGKIFIRDGQELYPVAININTYNLIVSPNEIIESGTNQGEYLEKIAPYLGLSEDVSLSDKVLLIEENKETNRLKDLLTRISQKNDFYELLKKDLTIEEVKEIKELGLPGVSFETVPRRYYPEKNIFSHLTGFVNLPLECDQEICQGSVGQYGLEKFFNEELSGQPGRRRGENAGGLNYSADDLVEPPRDGTDLVLTVDRAVQFFACQLLERAVEEYQASGGSIVVLDPKNGKIIALCNQPDFNPNQYSQVKNYYLFQNPAVNSSFEPGSIFKVITMAGGLDSGKVTPETVYLDPETIKIDGETIHNVENRTFGYQTMTGVLEKSINTGAVFVAQELGSSSFRNYLRKFGFGSLTRIELPDEASGDISNLEKKQKIYLATASFGQGITVTSIQIVNAVGAIANQGKLMKPYLIDSVIKDGQVIVQEPEFVRQVISPAAASSLTAMMISACENGYGKKARVKGYYVAGKTGTAQVPDKNGYSSEEVIQSFVGFAPATDPKFVALVKFDSPKKGNFADSTAVPTFGKLAEFMLNYYNLQPDKPAED